MSTKNKIKDEQLKDLQQKILTIQEIQKQVGILEGQKHLYLHQLVNAQDELQKTQNALQEEYGEVSISIQDGTYTQIDKEEA